MELNTFLREHRLHIDRDSKTLGVYARLRSRWGRPVTQEEIAECIGVSRAWYAMLETQPDVRTSPALLDRLAEALMLTPAERTSLFNLALPELKLGASQSAQPEHIPQVVPRNLNNLPPQLTSFVDREKVVADIKRLIQSHRLITLVGTGGAGKTRCAIRIGAEMFDGSADGVWMVEFAPLSDPSLVAGAIARSLNIQDSPQRPVLDTVLTFLKHKRLLLVLDNCEHVIDEVRRVAAAILRNCPDVYILATSREGLNIAGEQAYRMPSLAVPSTKDRHSVESVAHSPAVQLFTDRALRADNAFTLSDENAPHVAEICKRLDGIPLAIELAAARVNVLSPKQLEQKLDERFRVLTAGDRSAMPRHRTMRALVDWSHDLLSDDERRLFRKLSIFAGGFTLETAGAVCCDETTDEIAVLDLLASLVDKSLVQADLFGSSRRYRLLDSTRQYASQKLAESHEFQTVAQAHAATFLALAEELDGTWETTPESLWIARAERELENFRAAISWTLGAGSDALTGQRLASALKWVWLSLATGDGLRWVQVAQERVTNDTPSAVIAALDLSRAQLTATPTLYQIDRVAAERALARSTTLGNRAAVVEAKRLIALSLVVQGDVKKGQALLDQALAESRELGVRKLIARTLQGLASTLHVQADVSVARRLYTEALMSFRAVGADRSAAKTAGNLAETEFRGGDAAEALRIAEETLVIIRGVNDLLTAAYVLCNLTAYLVALERYESARQCGREALTLAREAGLEMGIPIAIQHLTASTVLRPADETTDEHRIRAARLLGYVNTRFAAVEAPREYTERQEYEKMLPALHDALGAHQLKKLMHEGSEWSEDHACAEALDLTAINARAS